MHFEEYFLQQWDSRKIDALEAAFEHTRRVIAKQTLAMPEKHQNHFAEGQQWAGT